MEYERKVEIHGERWRWNWEEKLKGRNRAGIGKNIRKKESWGKGRKEKPGKKEKT